MLCPDWILSLTPQKKGGKPLKNRGSQSAGKECPDELFTRFSPFRVESARFINSLIGMSTKIIPLGLG